MRINNNIMAMNTHRQYGVNNNNVSKSVEKLSSGYRVNRAGDDAAGLAISEKMRAQIRGLTMASKNSQDAVSLVQTAEGALQSTHDILQRMRELATQSASDTNESTIDRAALNKEFQALIKEIDDTAEKTKFNDMGVIDGTFAGAVTTVTSDNAKITAAATSGIADGTYAITATTTPDDTPALTNPSLGVLDATSITGPASIDSVTMALVDSGSNTIMNQLNGYSVKSISVTDGDALGANTGTNATISVVLSDGTKDITFTLSDTYVNLNANGGTGISLATTESGLTNTTVKLTLANISGFAAANVGALETAIQAEIDDGTNVKTIAGGANGVDMVPGKVTFSTTVGGVAYSGTAAKDATSVTLTAASGTDSITLTFDNKLPALATANSADTLLGVASGSSFNITTATTPGKDFTVQTGANKGDELKINIGKMDATELLVTANASASAIPATLADVKITDQASASNAIEWVNNAINQVSSQRADLGALQNRLEFKISNLDTSAENLQSAESRIRDLDMAQEMTKFTKNNILSQAATAMLAQANSLPQGVLQLLR